MQLGELLVQLRQGNKFEIALQRAILMPDSNDFFPRLERAWQQYAVLQKEILESISE